MSKVMLVSSDDLASVLGQTILWRSDVERYRETDPGKAQAKARDWLPNLIIVDARHSQGRELLRALREDEVTHTISLAALAPTATPGEQETLRRSGANVVLLGNPSSLWNSRLDELLNVPKRRQMRVPVNFMVWYQSGGGPPVQATSLNISINGMLLESEAQLEIGTKLEIRLRLSSGNSKEMLIVGQVVREAEPAHGRRRYGVEFLLLHGNARADIRDFVESAPTG